MEALLEAKVDVHEKASACGSPALHLAAIGIANLAKELYFHGRQAASCTSLDDKDTQRQKDTLKVLLEAGA